MPVMTTNPGIIDHSSTMKPNIQVMAVLATTRGEKFLAKPTSDILLYEKLQFRCIDF